MIDMEAGALFCNQCFAKGNGDGVAALQWLTGLDFKATVAQLTDHLGLQNGNGGTRDAKIVATYDYCNEQGDLLYQVVRYDPKDFRQRAPKPGGGWTWTVKNIRKVPYRLRELLVADLATIIYIVEGEQDVDRLVKARLVATTNAGGAGKWRPEYNEHFVGRHVVILPDNDELGRKHDQQVATALHSVVASVKVVELPGLPEKGDVSDWLTAGGTVEELARLVEEAPEWQPSAKPVRSKPLLASLAWRPFPVDVLPQPIRDYVKAGSHAMRCDPAYIALPMLAALASGIGATRRATLKPGWHESSVIWASVVAESGTMKSPAQALALQPLRAAQDWQLDQLPELLRQHEVNKALYDADYTAWKKKGRSQGEPPPEKPEEPTAKRFMVNDITVEALAEILAANPRGVLAAVDELATWLGGFDQYRSGRGSDAAKWLSIHRAESLIVDRKTGAKKTIFVKRAVVSLAGTIQPRALRRALGDMYFDNGLAARLLLASPPRMAKRWTEASVDLDTHKYVERVYGRLLALDFAVREADEPAIPIDVPLSADAKTIWISFYEEHAQVVEAAHGKLAAAYAKLEAYAVRFALVFSMVKVVSAETWPLATDVMIDADSMTAGVELARWFRHETDRVYSILEESDTETERRQVIELIQRHAGRITANDLRRRSRRFATSDDADKFLNELVCDGLGHWGDVTCGQSGGRPTRVFRLRDGVSVSETLESHE
jgi:hypothetical protein